MEYVVGTKYFAHQMLMLEALDYFDFFAKVDVDVHMLQTLNLGWHAAHWLHAFNIESAYSPLCTGTLHKHLLPYLDGAGCTAAQVPTAHALATSRGGWPTFYSNFVAGWLGLFQSPQLLAYSQFWWSWPGGWRHRWTDQEFWPAALSVTDSWSRVVNRSGVCASSSFELLAKGRRVGK